METPIQVDAMSMASNATAPKQSAQAQSVRAQSLSTQTTQQIVKQIARETANRAKSTWTWKKRKTKVWLKRKPTITITCRGKACKSAATFRKQFHPELAFQ